MEAHLTVLITARIVLSEILNSPSHSMALTIEENDRVLPVAIVAGAQLKRIIPSFSSVGPNEKVSLSAVSSCSLSSKGS